MHFLFFLSSILVVLRYDAYTEEAFEEGTSYSAKTLVALQDRPDFAFGLGSTKSGADSQEPPLAGPSLCREGQTSPEDDVVTSLEVRDLSTNGQRQRPPLSWLRLPLDPMCRSCPSRSPRDMELGRVSAVECKEEEKVEKPISPQESSGQHLCSQRERQGKWKREGQKFGKHWICATLAVLQLPDFPLGIGTMDYRDSGVQQWRDSSAYPVTELKYLDGEHRTGRGPCSSIPRSGSDAQRCARSDRPHKFPDGTIHHQGLACGDEQPWESQKDVAGDHRSEACPQGSVDATSSGFCGVVEQATTGFHAATSYVCRKGEQGNSRHPVGQQGNPNSESASGRGRQQIIPTTCRADAVHTHRCPNQKRSRGCRSPEEAAEGISELLGGHWRQGQQGHRRDPGVRRGGGRGNPQETKVPRTSASSNRPTNWTRCQDVKMGRVPCRHSLSKEHTRPQRPFFNPVAEAYDDHGGRCAASCGLEPVITFRLHDFIFPLRQYQPPPSGPWHETHIFAEELQAQRNALHLRSILLKDDFACLTGLQQRKVEWGKGNDFQSHVFDRWCIDCQEPSNILFPLTSQDGQPRISTCRPNNAITPDFDSIIPYRHRTRNGQLLNGRRHAPLHWDENLMLRAAGAHGAVYRDGADELQVRIRTWIASERTALILPHRDITVRAQLMNNLEPKVRRAWGPAHSRAPCTSDWDSPSNPPSPHRNQQESWKHPTPYIDCPSRN